MVVDVWRTWLSDLRTTLYTLAKDPLPIASWMWKSLNDMLSSLQGMVLQLQRLRVQSSYLVYT